jgi:glutathione-specific gamma-glutamylcyclotransferase
MALHKAGSFKYEKPGLEEFMTEHPSTGQRGLWVYGYGSLVDDPGFEAEERHLAVLPGYARGFVVYDTYHRGTRDKPGLTLGIDCKEDGRVPGAAYFVCEKDAKGVYDYLYERENPGGRHYYDMERLPVELQNGQTVQTLTFRADQEGPYYVGNQINLQEKANIVARAYGQPDPEEPGKSNLDYLVKTTMRLREECRPAPELERLMVRAVKARVKMINSEDMGERMLAWRLAKMERGSSVEKYFENQLGLEVVRGAFPPDHPFPNEPDGLSAQRRPEPPPLPASCPRRTP